MTTMTSLLAATGILAGTLVAVPAAADAATPMCTSGDMAASYHATDAATSHRFGYIVLRNVSGHSCWIHGFGGLSYVGHGNGTQIGAAADRVGTARTWIVPPGGRVRSAVSATTTAPYSAAYCRPTHVDGFRLYVPNSRVAKFIPHPTTGCANPRVHLLEIKAFRRP